MYYLFEHQQNGEPFCYGAYETLVQCQKVTELRWDVMQKLGYDRAVFHCTKNGYTEHAVGWVYRR